MGVIELLAGVAILVTLVAWVGSRLDARRGDGRSRPPQRPRPNVLFWLVGAFVMGGGVLAIIGGVEEVGKAADRPDQFEVTGATATADAVGIVIWGVVVLTIGAYVWRGARRRGWHDRVGRVVIIGGYLLLGIAMTKAVDRAVDIWVVAPEQAEHVGNDAMVLYLAWGVPAAALVFLGCKLAPERILLTSTMQNTS